MMLAGTDSLMKLAEFLVTETVLWNVYPMVQSVDKE